MTEQGFKRKLTAVFSADAVGYSRLMAEDEASTVKTIATYRKIMSSLIKQHRGRVVDSPGDNVLADFSSVVDAVQCAVALQNEFQTRNAELAENRRMEFRIGINLGDVIDEDDRIYGDGVNIAARLESMADPGGICVSKTAFDQIETKLPLGYEYLGEHPVKNIPKPVGAYRVLMQPRVTEAVKIEKEKPAIMRRKTIIVGAVVVLMVVIGIWQFYMRRPSVEPASVEKMEYPLPDKPSIAVLPFVNMSDDPTQEYFSDGITEDLITGLSKISDLFVIARNSTFTYKGKPVKIRQVAEELGVRYVLEGSVQKAAEKVRVSAQLIDATTGHHIWADRYEGNVANVFALQDNITSKIIEALAVKLTFDEKEAIPKKGTENLEAYLSFLKGWQHYRQNTPDAFLEAIALFEKAIELDPSYWRAYAALANIYFTVYQKVRWSRTLGIDRMDAIIKAKKNLNKAVNRHIPLAHAVAALIHIDESDFEEAIAEAERAVSLDLNDPDSHFVMGYTLISVGRHREAVDSFKRAIRLNPYNQDTYGIGLGIAYFFMLEFEKAVTLLERAFKNNPENERPIWYLPAAYAHLNRMQEAKAALAKLKEFNPIYARLFFIKDAYYLKNPQDYNLITEGMRKAGMK
jgi:TolB-like protein/class 3 adenylate cyclase/Flp pilus assembly protein TadD